MNGFMFQGLAELRRAKARTALIIVTVLMITLMVTFLSSLAAGLQHQSVSALQNELSGGKALVVAGDNLSSSQLSSQQEADVNAAGGELVHLARTPDAMHISRTDGQQPADLYLEHQPVVWGTPEEVADMPGAATVGIVPADAGVDGALEGKDALNTSASYKGEQQSLGLMINLLYVISALVLGAFFAVWTVQRLRGVAISAALGASRSVIITDAVGQALVVLAIGVTFGAAITVLAGTLISGIPMVVSLRTVGIPVLILLAAGLLGAALSIRPVLKINPRTALNA